MYFPFLTCEVKCGAEALNIAAAKRAQRDARGAGRRGDVPAGKAREGA